MTAETAREKKKKVVLAHVTVTMCAALDALADKRGMSRAGVVRQAIREAIGAEDGGEIA